VNDATSFYDVFLLLCTIQKYHWRGFPITRADGINKQVLTVILIHHLLVYNFLNQVRHLSNLNNSDEFYTSFVNEMAKLIVLSSYGFGILRSNTQVGLMCNLLDLTRKAVETTYCVYL